MTGIATTKDPQAMQKMLQESLQAAAGECRADIDEGRAKVEAAKAKRAAQLSP